MDGQFVAFTVDQNLVVVVEKDLIQVWVPGKKMLITPEIWHQLVHKVSEKLAKLERKRTAKRAEKLDAETRAEEAKESRIMEERRLALEQQAIPVDSAPPLKFKKGSRNGKKL